MAVNKTISMVNVSESPVTIRVGGTPGEGVTEYTIKPGEAQAFHENYCKPVPGAGSSSIPSIMERKSMRTFPDGVRRPALVPADEAPKAKSEYSAAVDAWRKSKSKSQPNQQQGAGT